MPSETVQEHKEESEPAVTNGDRYLIIMEPFSHPTMALLAGDSETGNVDCSLELMQSLVEGPIERMPTLPPGADLWVDEDALRKDHVFANPWIGASVRLIAAGTAVLATRRPAPEGFEICGIKEEAANVIMATFAAPIPHMTVITTSGEWPGIKVTK